MECAASSHASAVDIINKSGSSLENTRVVFLPGNSTSRLQPLDQGVMYEDEVHKRISKKRYHLGALKYNNELN